METTLKLFRPHAGPALELCSHFESIIDASPNKVRGGGFHVVISQLMESVAAGSPITPSMAGQWTAQCDWALQIQAELVPKVWGIEEEVTLYDSEGEFVTSGTLDLWGRKDGKLQIIDWKTGQERAYGAQLAIYAVALMDRTGEREIGLHTAFVDQERVFSYTATLDELRRRVDNLVEAVRDPASPYFVNQYCGYCDLRNTCPAWESDRRLVAGMVPDASLSLEERFATLKEDPEKLARFITAFRRLKNLVQKVERLDSVALEMISSGERLPGLQKITRKGDESINAASLKSLIAELNSSELDQMLKVDLKVARELWTKYSIGLVPFPQTQVGEPTEYIALSRNGK